MEEAASVDGAVQDSGKEEMVVRYRLCHAGQERPPVHVHGCISSRPLK